MGTGEWGVGGAGGDEGDVALAFLRNATRTRRVGDVALAFLRNATRTRRVGDKENNQCPMPNAQCPTIRAILSLPAKIVAIVTELIWQ